MSKKKLNQLMIKLKRGGLFFLGISLFLTPSQNYYSTLSLNWQPSRTRQVTWILPEPVPYPQNISQSAAPRLTAKSVAILDIASGVLVYGKEESTTLLPASTSKIMTALVALDYYQPEDILTVQQARSFGQDMKLITGEQMAFKNLLAGVLIYSANDAAWVLAQNYPDGETEFIKAMNNKAKALHLDHTYFANPTGVNSDDQGGFLTDFSYTTALDLARLTVEALKNPTFKELVATKRMTVADISGKYQHQLFNLNELLGNLEGVKGVKTGWTEDAQGCLVAYTERDGRKIVSVVLGSADRFGETKRLINWVFDNFSWVAVNPLAIAGQ